MGIPVLIIGQSGTGKTYSIRNMPPESTGVINVARKPFPFRARIPGIATDSYPEITSLLVRASAHAIIIDDAQYLMANAYMRRAKETGYQKFTDIGLDFWNLVQEAIRLPAEKIIYFIGHTEVTDIGGVKFKTIGKMLDEKITVEGMFAIVLRTVVQDGVYQFSTQNDGRDTCKSPPEMFASQYIPNDMLLVDQAIRAYYGLDGQHG